MLEERVKSLESQLKDTTRKNPAEPLVAHVPPETAKELESVERVGLSEQACPNIDAAAAFRESFPASACTPVDGEAKDSGLASKEEKVLASEQGEDNVPDGDGHLDRSTLHDSPDVDGAIQHPSTGYADVARKQARPGDGSALQQAENGGVDSSGGFDFPKTRPRRAQVRMS